MADQKQYKRLSNSLDRQIIGESSNGINISKDGNTYLFTGNNEEYLQALRSGSISSDKGEIATNDPNNVSSFIGMYKQGGANINLGNPNQQSLNINSQPAKNENIVTPAITVTPTALPSVEPTPTPTPTPTVTPTPVGPVEEDIQDFKFEELPDQEGFQLFLEQEIGEFEEDNPDMDQPSPVLITGVTGAPTGTGGGGFLQPGVGGIINVATSKVGASAYPGPPDFKAAGYQNGSLPMSALIGVSKGGRSQYVYNGTGGWYLLHPEAAKQYLALLQFGKANNIKWTLTSAYRDRAHQASLGSGRTVASAGSSPHGWAIAIDISELYGSVSGGVDKGDPAANARARANSTLYQWFAANAPKYGFYNPFRLADGRGVDEVWHWEYWGFFIK